MNSTVDREILNRYYYDDDEIPSMLQASNLYVDHSSKDHYEITEQHICDKWIKPTARPVILIRRT